MLNTNQKEKSWEDIKFELVTPNRLKFMKAWNSMPVWFKYLMPHLTSLAVCASIFILLDFDFSHSPVWAQLLFSQAGLGSLLVGYLKELNNELKDLNELPE